MSKNETYHTLSKTSPVTINMRLGSFARILYPYEGLSMLLYKNTNSDVKVIDNSLYSGVSVVAGDDNEVTISTDGYNFGIYIEVIN